MAQEVCVIVDAGDRVRLVAITADRNRPQKHVQRARIVLLCAGRLTVAEVACQVAVSRPAVWRWQGHRQVERAWRAGPGQVGSRNELASRQVSL